ncbi:MAG: hypothetical protein K2N74_01320, partial [Clostridiales bacterium]|nr:hypothetical protein [Clostridiales bacterium]
MSKIKKLLLAAGVILCVLVVVPACRRKPDSGHVHGAQWSYVQNENNKHFKKCNVDGCEGVQEDCSFERSVNSEASCTNSGEAQFTCACGNSYTEAIPAAGHLEQLTYTYTKNNTHTWVCGRQGCTGGTGSCDYKIVEDNRTDCSEAGSGVQECTLCGHRENITLAAGKHSLNLIAA